MSNKETEQQMKPMDPNDVDEVAVAEFFKALKPGWVVERPAPSIERVSCYVLNGGSVHVTEYQGRSFSVYLQIVGADGLPDDWGKVLQALNAWVR